METRSIETERDLTESTLQRGASKWLWTCQYNPRILRKCEANNLSSPHTCVDPLTSQRDAADRRQDRSRSYRPRLHDDHQLAAMLPLSGPTGDRSRRTRRHASVRWHLPMTHAPVAALLPAVSSICQTHTQRSPPCCRHAAVRSLHLAIVHAKLASKLPLVGSPCQSLSQSPPSTSRYRAGRSLL